MLKVESELHGNLSILKLNGNIDLDGSMILKEHIQEARKSGALIVLLNFSGVENVTSSVLQNLVTPIKALSMIKGKVALCNMSSAVHKFIQTAMFYQLVEIFDTEEEAVQTLTAEKK